MEKFFKLFILGIFVIAILLSIDAGASCLKPNNLQSLQVLGTVLKPKPVIIGSLK